MTELLPVVILCGGASTRLRGSGLDDLPKPLIPIGERPMLWHIMKLYAAFGHSDFVLALGYRGEMIRRYFLEYEPMSRDFTIALGQARRIEYHADHAESNWRVTLADTGATAHTGARVKRIERYIPGERFFVTYGDGVGNVDLDQLLAFHRGHGKLATLTGVRPFSQFGVMETDGTRVTGFREKPQVEGYVNGGFFVFERGVFDYLEEPDDLELEKEPLQNLARDGQLCVYPHTGFWRAMDTFKDVQALTAIWESGQAPWKVW
ncbi:MAG TPA: glucose-1-phosphate cytidylyltransferase [Anaerolineae bacterium]|nr:glucose-1-phosphate cytidylyltransferase [Anaerolineae bacterium]